MSPKKSAEQSVATLSLRLPEKLRAEMEELAKIADRSLNSEIVHAIRKHVAEMAEIDAKIIASATSRLKGKK